MSDLPTTLDALASLGTSMLRVNRGVIVKGHRQTPEKTLELFEAEYCPFCRHVREALTELDLDAMIYPIPKGGKRYRQRLIKLGGKAKIPFLHDPNTGQKLYESEAIAEYLYKQYGYDWETVPKRRILTSTLATATRGKKGMFAVPSKPARKPLELYSFEGSPYARLARETLCELQVSYLLHNVGKTPGGHSDYLPPAYRFRNVPDYMPGTENRRKYLKRTGRIQMPYVIDPNTSTSMLETKDIIAYLKKTYGAEDKAAGIKASNAKATKASVETTSSKINNAWNVAEKIIAGSVIPELNKIGLGAPAKLGVDIVGKGLSMISAQADKPRGEPKPLAKKTTSLKASAKVAGTKAGTKRRAILPTASAPLSSAARKKTVTKTTAKPAVKPVTAPSLSRKSAAKQKAGGKPATKARKP